MKVIFFLLLTYACSIQILFATPSGTGSNLPISDCLKKVQSYPLVLNFSNFYHTGSTLENTNLVMMARNTICSFYVMWGSVNDIYIKQVIPIYQPKRNNPIAYQFIYMGQDYNDNTLLHTGAWLYWWTRAFPTPGIINTLPWFQGWRLTDGGYWNKMYEGNTDALFKSFEEPFRSAEVVQMYYYLNQPLLVARSNTGIVTDVFFQGHLNIANPMMLAKRYLWDKWYHP